MPSQALAYGHSHHDFALPEQAQVLTPCPVPANINAEQFEEQLQQHLAERNLNLSDCAVVVADKTRRCGYETYLPVLLKALERNGAGKITLYIAYGTHAPQTEAESLASYGEVFHEYHFVHHTCSDSSLFVDKGTTARGTPIRIRRDLLTHSALITFGALSHHYFAGYGGARKLIFPGLGEREAIFHNHGLFLDREHRRLQPSCQPGRLEGNPLAEDLQEVADHAEVDLAIHGILTPEGEVADLILGTDLDDFHRACARHDEGTRVGQAQRYDLVLASCGGGPKDVNLIQAHKSIHHASLYLKDGGTLLLLAECPDGVGSQTFLPWFDCGGFDAAFKRLQADYQGNGGTALALMTKTARIRIGLMTELPTELCASLALERLSADAIQERLSNETGRIAVLPKAALTLPAQQ
ncbi:MAG: lactate racemase domain-containing protein [Planctomycetota bacterium]|jgi:nickel-dependent lactate racemase